MLIKSIAKQTLSGLAAGLLITIGCCVYLGCDTKWVGAILFSVALLSICIMNFSLFTGRVGFIVTEPSKEKFSALFLGLRGNVIATAVVGIAVQYAIPNLHDVAVTMCEAKLTQQLWQTLIRGILCGVLMYSAVGVYKNKKRIVGIIFCITVFI
ncbi:MAG: formate/nitrite transporter family protein, partial [Clostridia bacterium]|nr:formate/nitrite transporter family protein [Clostridia bacterium]